MPKAVLAYPIPNLVNGVERALSIWIESEKGLGSVNLAKNLNVVLYCLVVFLPELLHFCAPRFFRHNCHIGSNKNIECWTLVQFGPYALQEIARLLPPEAFPLWLKDASLALRVSASPRSAKVSGWTARIAFVLVARILPCVKRTLGTRDGARIRSLIQTVS